MQEIIARSGNNITALPMNALNTVTKVGDRVLGLPIDAVGKVSPSMASTLRANETTIFAIVALYFGWVFYNKLNQPDTVVTGYDMLDTNYRRYLEGPINVAGWLNSGQFFSYRHPEEAFNVRSFQESDLHNLILKWTGIQTKLNNDYLKNSAFNNKIIKRQTFSSTSDGFTVPNMSMASNWYQKSVSLYGPTYVSRVLPKSGLE